MRADRARLKGGDMISLFGDLPDDPAPLPSSDAGLLASLPIYPETVALDDWDEASARRLERRGVIKIHREKSDPIAHRPTWYAGRLP